jgi:1-acyl-sn-glycerol-3-phosphate acyltransferase
VLVTLHMLGGLLTVFTVFPLVRLETRNRIIGAWSRWLVALCGVRLVLDGEPIPAELRATGIDGAGKGRLVVSNHISWLDSFAMHAVLPCRFVAKSEISNWPLLGLLVTRSGMLFIERGRRHAVASVNHKVREHLLQGETIAIYPEGTTGDGSELLRFHSNLLAPAIETGVPVWPFALRYVEGGKRSSAVAFVGEMSFATSLIRILSARGVTARITRLAPIEVTLHENRHAVARAAYAAIADALVRPIDAGPHDGVSGYQK